MSSVGDRAMFTTLLRESVLTLCRTTMASHRYLNVDGIVCVTAGDDSDDEESSRWPIVVRIHEKLPRAAHKPELTFDPKHRRRHHDEAFYARSYPRDNSSSCHRPDSLKSDSAIAQHISDMYNNHIRSCKDPRLPRDSSGDADLENQVPNKVQRKTDRDDHFEAFRPSERRGRLEDRCQGDPFLRSRSASECALSSGLQRHVAADELPPKSKSADHVSRISHDPQPLSGNSEHAAAHGAGSKVSGYGGGGRVLSHSAPRRLSCRVCDEVFLDILSLERHNLQRHATYTCSICTTTFTARNNLKRHARMHSGIKPFKCSTCKAAFARKDDLKTHELRHVRPSSRRSFSAWGRAPYGTILQMMMPPVSYKQPSVELDRGDHVMRFDNTRTNSDECSENARAEMGSDLTLKRPGPVQNHNAQLRHAKELDQDVGAACRDDVEDKAAVDERAADVKVQAARTEVMENLSSQYWCTECQVGFQDEAALSQHISDTHERRGEDQPPRQDESAMQKVNASSCNDHGEERPEEDCLPVDLTGDRRTGVGSEDKASNRDAGEEENGEEKEDGEAGCKGGERKAGGRWITLEKPCQENMETLKSLSMRREPSLASDAGSTTGFLQRPSAASPAALSPLESPLRVVPLNLSPPEKNGARRDAGRSLFPASSIQFITLMKPKELDGVEPTPRKNKTVDKQSMLGSSFGQAYAHLADLCNSPQVKVEPKSPDVEDCVGSPSSNSSGASSATYDSDLMGHMQHSPDLPTDLSARRSASPSLRSAALDSLRAAGFERVVTPPILFRSQTPPLDCPLCQDVFHSFAELEAHSARDHRRYLCEYCGKAFTAKPNRDRHVRYHTGERPYRCSLCPQAFFRGDDLKYHRTTKHAQHCQPSINLQQW